MRDIWRTTIMTYGAKLGYAKSPVKFKSTGIRNLIVKALFQQNVRPLLKEGQKRHEWKTAHGFRKFFKTKADQVMRTSNWELLMGHDLGVAKCYYKPLDDEILEDYLKAIQDLTILENKSDVLKDFEEKKIKSIEEKHQTDIEKLREDMENKFQQILLKINVENLRT